MKHLGISHLIHKQTEKIYICCRCGEQPQIINTVVHLNGGKRTITRLQFAEFEDKPKPSTEQRFKKLGLVLPEDIR